MRGSHADDKRNPDQFGADGNDAPRSPGGNSCRSRRGVCRARDFGADGAVDGGADLFEELEDGAAGFADHGRVGGDAVDEPGGGEFTDVVDVGAVDEEFHVGGTAGVVGLEGAVGRGIEQEVAEVAEVAEMGGRRDLD